MEKQKILSVPTLLFLFLDSEVDALLLPGYCLNKSNGPLDVQSPQ